MDDYLVCCEVPMVRWDFQDQDGSEYYYYVCPQCGACTDVIVNKWPEEEPSDYEE